jgi:hypothetical protein
MIEQKRSPEEEADFFREKMGQLRRELKKTIVGQEGVIELIITAMFADGHVLIEGLPGLVHAGPHAGRHHRHNGDHDCRQRREVFYL